MIKGYSETLTRIVKCVHGTVRHGIEGSIKNPPSKGLLYI